MYRINTANGDIHCPDGAIIRVPYEDEGYAAYSSWVQAGNSPECFDGGSDVPTSVTRFQALAALEAFGMLDTVEAMMASPSMPKMARLAWQNALMFERNSPTATNLAAALSLSEQALDDLFRAAASVQA